MQILIVEDEPAIADNITYALSTEGFKPVWVTTGNEALKKLSSEEFSLIVLDVGLPDVNGFDLCREIRKSTSIPIIFLTARAEEVDRIVGLEIGADDYLVKPFSPRELAARVKAILRRASGSLQAEEKSTKTSKTPFKIDEDRQLVTYFDQKLNLTRYEFRLLKVLVTRPGWVFSREKLMELAWEEPEMSLDRTVDAHIKSLRAKLKLVKPDIEAIITHRGVGYALKESW